MSGDRYRRTFIEDRAACGCTWAYGIYGETLMECPTHHRATEAMIARIEARTGCQWCNGTRFTPAGVLCRTCEGTGKCQLPKQAEVNS